MEKIEDWEKYTSENLEFPFDAVICDYQDKGPLQLGDKLSVKSVDGCDDLYGVIVVVRHGRKKYRFQLLDLEAVDKKSKNQKIINAYQEAYMETRG